MSLKSSFLALGCVLLMGLGWGFVAAITAAGPGGVSLLGLISHGLFGLIVLAGLFVLWRMVDRGLAELQKTLDCANEGDISCRMEVDLPGELGRFQAALRRLLESFRERLAFSQGVLQGISVPAAVFSRENQALFVNQALLDLIGRPGKPESFLGQSSGQIIYNDPARWTASQQAMEESRQIVKELDFRAHDGQSRHVRVVSTPYRDQDGRVTGTVAFWIDLSELKVQHREAEARAETLGQAAHGIEGVSESLSGISEELASLVEESARGAVIQRDRVTETASAMEEMNATVLEVARNASMAAEATAKAKDKAQEGARAVEVSVAAISRVESQAGVLSGNMQRLNEQAARIGAIIDVISEIADQTNLLALNAAIEAARAGDAGRGFAVVADEVRKLAEKTMSATKEVGEAIAGIQNATDDSAKSVAETSAAIAKATELAQDSGQALTEIVELVESAADQVRSIATASEEQSAASEEINRAIEEVNTIAGETSEGMSHSENAVKELARLSAELLRLVQVFGGREAANLAASEHKMKGVLPKLMQEYVRESLGEKVYATMQAEMGKPVFLPTGSYPDKVIRQMAEIAARASGKSASRILHDFGFYTPGGFSRYYKKYFKTADYREFLRSLNKIHGEVAKDMPGVEVPTFDIEESPEGMTITYHSKRGLHDYFEGVIKGAAKFLKTEATVNLTRIDAETSRALVRFRR
jgi:methyl-accepting chemotaxis protein